MTFIRGIAGSAAISAAMLIGPPAQSAPPAYVVDLTQVGSNVVATGSGAIDLTGLTLLHTDFGISSGLDPSYAFIITAPPNQPPLGMVSAYTGFTGPTSFGGGSFTLNSSGSGDYVGIIGNGNLEDAPWLIVPIGYVSDSRLSDSSTYDNATFKSLGVTPGRYEWTWGTGAHQSFTLVIGVPEPSTWAMMLIGFAGLGFMAYQTAGLRRTVVDA